MDDASVVAYWRYDTLVNLTYLSLGVLTEWVKRWSHKALFTREQDFSLCWLNTENTTFDLRTHCELLFRVLQTDIGEMYPRTETSDTVCDRKNHTEISYPLNCALNDIAYVYIGIFHVRLFKHRGLKAHNCNTVNQVELDHSTWMVCPPAMFLPEGILSFIIHHPEGGVACDITPKVQVERRRPVHMHHLRS